MLIWKENKLLLLKVKKLSYFKRADFYELGAHAHIWYFSISVDWKGMWQPFYSHIIPYEKFITTKKQNSIHFLFTTSIYCEVSAFLKFVKLVKQQKDYSSLLKWKIENNSLWVNFTYSLEKTDLLTLVIFINSNSRVYMHIKFVI